MKFCFRTQKVVEFEEGTNKHYLNLKSNNVDVVLVVDVSLPVCPSRCLLHFTDVIIPAYYSFSLYIMSH